ncbi:MAG: hypothetical protein LBT00_10005 [Spirochaetaceae bacterium]|nr:hypothetical protein [Spirochaetaceae bacterium]
MLCGVAIPVGNRSLSSTRPKGRILRYCYPHRLPLAQQYPLKGGVLGGVAVPVGCCLLNSTRPKEACYSVLSFRPGEHHRKAALLPQYLSAVVRRLEIARYAGSTAACRWCSPGISTRPLNSTRPKVCCVEWLSLPIAAH